MYKTGALKKQLQLSHGNFFIILNLLDYLTTHVLISLDGQELMPFGAQVIQDYGMPGLLSYKLSLTFLILILGIRLKFSNSLWSVLNGVFTGIVTWNNLGVFLSLLFDPIIQ